MTLSASTEESVNPYAVPGSMLRMTTGARQLCSAIDSPVDNFGMFSPGYLYRLGVYSVNAVASEDSVAN